MLHLLKDFCISSNCSIRDAMSCIDKSGVGIAIVVDDEMRLVGIISDGDYRRAVLAGFDLETSVKVLLSQKTKLDRNVNILFSKPITAKRGTDSLSLLAIMRSNGVRHVPILDDEDKVVDLICIDDLVPPQNLSLRAVVMAGGYGTRLRPLTNDLPKPMLPVGGKPLMQHVIEQLKSAGIHHVTVTTHYKPEQIEKHFGDGSSFGLNINYVNEDKPLGTGGALGLMDVPVNTVLIINGDIITNLNFRLMLDYHREHKADMTVAVKQYLVQIPFGVIECDGPIVLGVSEKPVLKFLVNAGIYLIEPSVYKLIPRGKSFHMTDLIAWLKNDKRLIVNFPLVEYWLDIGQHIDYQKAQNDVISGELDI